MSGKSVQSAMQGGHAPVFLGDTAKLMEFLESTLVALEDCQGGVDVEARAKLDELRQSAAALAQAQAADPHIASTFSEVEGVDVVQQLEGLESQILNVEANLRNAEEATKQLLSHSTAVWTGTSAENCISSDTDKVKDNQR